jgi:threonine dehydrogenase-like Zn-dependent dehydrogenase
MPRPRSSPRLPRSPGPVGLATGMLAKALGAWSVVGTDPSPQRRHLAVELGAVESAVSGGDAELDELLDDGADVSVDCSGSGSGQLTALGHTRRWGRVALVGEGATLSVDVSPVIIHRQLTIVGSWVTSTYRMSELLDRLARWRLHPEVVVRNRFALGEAAEAYRVADSGVGGKVGIAWPDGHPSG